MDVFDGAGANTGVKEGPVTRPLASTDPTNV